MGARSAQRRRTAARKARQQQAYARWKAAVRRAAKRKGGVVGVDFVAFFDLPMRTKQEIVERLG
jgi:hypothetical protein